MQWLTFCSILQLRRELRAEFDGSWCSTSTSAAVTLTVVLLVRCVTSLQQRRPQRRSRTHSPPYRPVAEVIAKEKLSGLPAACVAGLACVPFVMPTQWEESQSLMARQLAMYTIHEEPAIRKARAFVPLSLGKEQKRTLTWD